MNRSCGQYTLEKLSFLCYSKSCGGVFYLLCVLFPDISHQVAKQLIYEPYQDWKDLLEDIKNHPFTEYYLNSMVRLNQFMKTMNNPEKVIGVAIKNQKNF